jgi:hypothetical protein
MVHDELAYMRERLLCPLGTSEALRRDAQFQDMVDWTRHASIHPKEKLATQLIGDGFRFMMQSNVQQVPPGLIRQGVDSQSAVDFDRNLVDTQQLDRTVKRLNFLGLKKMGQELAQERALHRDENRPHIEALFRDTDLYHQFEAFGMHAMYIPEAPEDMRSQQDPATAARTFIQTILSRRIGLPITDMHYNTQADRFQLEYVNGRSSSPRAHTVIGDVIRSFGEPSLSSVCGGAFVEGLVKHLYGAEELSPEVYRNLVEELVGREVEGTLDTLESQKMTQPGPDMLRLALVLKGYDPADFPCNPAEKAVCSPDQRDFVEFVPQAVFRAAEEETPPRGFIEAESAARLARNEVIRSRLMYTEPYRRSLPLRAQEETLRLCFEPGQPQAQDDPMIPGYKLLSRHFSAETGRVYYGFVEDPENDPYVFCPTPLSTERKQYLAERYYKMGLTQLSDCLVKSDLLRVGDLAEILTDESLYASYENGKKLNVDPNGGLDQVRCLVKNGRFVAQCTGANTILQMSLNEVFGPRFTRLTRGEVLLTSGSEAIPVVGHAQALFIDPDTGRQYLLDATPQHHESELRELEHESGSLEALNEMLGRVAITLPVTERERERRIRHRMMSEYRQAPRVSAEQPDTSWLTREIPLPRRRSIDIQLRRESRQLKGKVARALGVSPRQGGGFEEALQAAIYSRPTGDPIRSAATLVDQAVTNVHAVSGDHIRSAIDLIDNFLAVPYEHLSAELKRVRHHDSLLGVIRRSLIRVESLRQQRLARMYN